MKKLIALALFTAALSIAGPLKVATYPIVHPVKTAHALKNVGKALFYAGKALGW